MKNLIVILLSVGLLTATCAQALSLDGSLRLPQPVVTPATFFVNVNTLQAWPLALGIADMPAVRQRITQILNASPD